MQALVPMGERYACAATVFFVVFKASGWLGAWLIGGLWRASSLTWCPLPVGGGGGKRAVAAMGGWE